MANGTKKVAKVYNAREISMIFDRTPAWVYWCIANGKFVYENGEPIKPAKVSPGGGRRQYDLDGIQEMALSLYRINQLSEEKLQAVMAKIVERRIEEKE